MNRSERLLYQQVHPLKLVTDSSAGAVSYHLLWRHRLRAALGVQFLLAIGSSLAVIHGGTASAWHPEDVGLPVTFVIPSAGGTSPTAATASGIASAARTAC